MRLARDLIGTLFVGVAVAVYAVVLGGSSVLFISDPRGVAAAGLVLGLAACMAAGDSMATTTKSTWRSVAGVLVAAVVVAGVITVIANGWVTLAVFIGLLLALWAATTVRHIAAVGRGSLPTAGAARA